MGGAGGGGAGGTVKIVASAISGSAEIDTRGGQAASGGQAGGDSRFVFGHNTTGGWSGSLSGSTRIDMVDGAGRNLGVRGLNPFVFGHNTETPYHPGLVDGAEVFGLTMLSSADEALAVMFGDMPANAVAALVLMDIDPLGLDDDWDGFDLLLLANLTDRAFAAPRLGVGQKGHLADALVGGYTRNPFFGGSGYDELGALSAYGVYATLVPKGIGFFNVGFSGEQFFNWAETLEYNQPLYVVPEPGTLALLALGVVAVLRRRRAGAG